MKSRKEVEAEVRSWGFSHVFTWTDGANARKRPTRGLFLVTQIDNWFCLLQDYPPHSHAGLTTHVILSGQLTIAYPQDGDAEQRKKKTTYGVGDRIDVDAGRVHEVWMGEEGCTYVIGEWNCQDFEARLLERTQAMTGTKGTDTVANSISFGHGDAVFKQ
jgi:hypothetical protein